MDVSSISFEGTVMCNASAEAVRIQPQVAVLSPGSSERLLQVELYRGYKWDLIRISKRKHKAIAESTTGQPSSAVYPLLLLVLGSLEILNSGLLLLLFSVLFLPPVPSGVYMCHYT